MPTFCGRNTRHIVPRCPAALHRRGAHVHTTDQSLFAVYFGRTSRWSYSHQQLTCVLIGLLTKASAGGVFHSGSTVISSGEQHVQHVCCRHLTNTGAHPHSSGDKRRLCLCFRSTQTQTSISPSWFQADAAAATTM